MVKEAPGVWGDGEMGRWGDGEMGGWGVWEKLKNIHPHHYHAGLPNFVINSLWKLLIANS
ncbi:MAG: hypothetical protein QNJ74_12510 [Trichodesmium sp. MO_231.B1]|nr:hypothetical protein [Trichodesmium sp. MO_231.B1]